LFSQEYDAECIWGDYVSKVKIVCGLCEDWLLTQRRAIK
jgi:hypothetical protein